jgi:hypothetical protein
VGPGNLNLDIVKPANEVASGSSWASSSFDLLHGVDVSEDDPTTIPAELYDELLNVDTTDQPDATPSRGSAGPNR